MSKDTKKDNWTATYGWDDNQRPNKLDVRVYRRFYDLPKEHRQQSFEQLSASVYMFLYELEQRIAQ